MQWIGHVDTGISLDWGDLDPIFLLLKTVVLCTGDVTEKETEGSDVAEECGRTRDMFSGTT